MHTQNRVVQSSRARRDPRKPVTAARSSRNVGSRWRAAAVAMTVGCAATLSACGGGGGGSSSPEPVAAQAPATTAKAPQPTVKIAMFGDSTTYGSTFETGSYTQSPHNEPAALQANLQQKYGTAVTVENHGVPGSTCPELLYGQAPVTQPWTVAMANSDAQIVTVNEGINDAFLPGETDQDFIYCYSQLAAIAKQYGKTFVLMTPNPINDTHNANLWSLVHDEQYVAQTQGVAIVDQWDAIQTGFPGWAADLPDNIHPNDALYEIKAQNSSLVVAPIISSLIRGS